MGTREDAIKQILDEGADMTQENIRAVEKSMETQKKAKASSDNERMLQAVNQQNAKLDRVIELLGERQTITIPEIKVPDIHVPEPRAAAVPAVQKRNFRFKFVRDESGNIIDAQAFEE